MNIYTPWTHTRSSGQRFFAAVAGEQLAVWCLAQGHLSHGIEGGESVVYMHSPNLQFLPVWDSNLQPFDYESDSLTIRPRLAPTCDYTSHKKKGSSHFPLLFRNRLKITWDRRAYLWSDLDLRFVSFDKSNYIAEKMDAKRLQKNSKKTAVLKVAKICIQFAYIYVHWTK